MDETSNHNLPHRKITRRSLLKFAWTMAASTLAVISGAEALTRITGQDRKFWGSSKLLENVKTFGELDTPSNEEAYKKAREIYNELVNISLTDKLNEVELIFDDSEPNFMTYNLAISKTRDPNGSPEEPSLVATIIKNDQPKTTITGIAEITKELDEMAEKTGKRFSNLYVRIKESAKAQGWPDLAYQIIPNQPVIPDDQKLIQHEVSTSFHFRDNPMANGAFFTKTTLDGYFVGGALHPLKVSAIRSEFYDKKINRLADQIVYSAEYSSANLNEPLRSRLYVQTSRLFFEQAVKNEN